MGNPAGSKPNGLAQPGCDWDTTLRIPRAEKGAALGCSKWCLETAPEVCLILLVYPILLDLQIRPRFQESNPPADISHISRSHLYCCPSLSVSLSVTKKQVDQAPCSSSYSALGQGPVLIIYHTLEHLSTTEQPWSGGLLPLPIRQLILLLGTAS